MIFFCNLLLLDAGNKKTHRVLQRHSTFGACVQPSSQTLLEHHKRRLAWSYLWSIISSYKRYISRILRPNKHNLSLNTKNVQFFKPFIYQKITSVCVCFHMHVCKYVHYTSTFYNADRSRYTLCLLLSKANSKTILICLRLTSCVH